TRTRRGRTEGSIFYRKADNHWVGSVSLGYDGNGKRKRRFVFGDSKLDVQNKLQRLHLDASAGTLPDTGRLKVGDFLTRWLEATAKPKLRPNTYVRYELLVRKHLKPEIGGVQLAKLRALHVECCYAALQKAGASAWTRKMAGMVLSCALRHAV